MTKSGLNGSGQRRSIAQQQIGARLVAWREARGMRQQDVAQMLRVHTVTLSRFENGRGKPKPATLRELGRIYEVPGEEVEQVVGLSVASEAAGWTVPYRDIITPTVSALADIEAHASAVFDYSTELLPALLQTPSYAEALINLATEVGPEVRHQRLAFRFERQQRILARNPLPAMKFVVNEAVLRTHVLTGASMKEQLAHLLRLSRQKGIEIRVRKLSAGPHRWMSGAFTLLQSGDDLYPHVVYTENQFDGRYFEKNDQVEHFARVFAEIRRKTVPMREFEL